MCVCNYTFIESILHEGTCYSFNHCVCLLSLLAPPANPLLFVEILKLTPPRFAQLFYFFFIWMSTSVTVHQPLSTNATKSSSKKSSSHHSSSVKIIATASPSSSSPPRISIFTAIPSSSIRQPTSSTTIVPISPSSGPTSGSHQANDINSVHNTSTSRYYMPLFCVLAGVVAVGLGLFVWFICKRKRKLDTEAWQQNTTGWSSCQSTMRNDVSPVYLQTAKQVKRLTSDTLVEERASLSTMVSKRQYAPQLAYSPSKQSLNRHSDGTSVYEVSPSATLIDHLGVTIATDLEKQKSLD